MPTKNNCLFALLSSLFYPKLFEPGLHAANY